MTDCRGHTKEASICCFVGRAIFRRKINPSTADTEEELGSTISPTAAEKEQPQEDYNLRFRDQDIAFADGAKGQNFEIPTANPANYFHVISNSTDLPRLAI